MANEIREGIEEWGVFIAPTGQKFYAYEVDGYCGRNLMDDANVSSLLSAPFLRYLDMKDPNYLQTRKFILSRMNPWWGSGSVMNGIKSQHIRPSAPWPMSSIIRAMTTDDHWEIWMAIKELLSSTDGLGLMHESVDSNDASQWTRQWFTWANGLFGQLILDLRDRKPQMLKENFQTFPHQNRSENRSES